MDELRGDIRILHVDDDEAFAEMVGRYLEKEAEDFDVVTATSPDEALEVLSDRDVDCVVSDYDMPGRNGVEFLGDVRAEYPDLPFVLFTGKGSEEVASEAISAGVTDYLQKESGVEQFSILANRVRNAVRGHRSRRALEDRNRRLETLISNLPGIVYRCRDDPRWPMEVVGGDCEPLTGYPASAIEGDEVNWGEDVIHPEDKQTVWETVQHALDTGDPFELTYRIQSASGERKWVFERGREVESQGEGRIIEGFITDITAQKEHEQDLTRYRGLVNAMRDAAFICDADGRYELANESLADLYDTTSATLEGAPCHLLSMLRDDADGDPYADLVAGEVDELDGTIETTLPGPGETILDYRLSRLTVDGAFDGVVGVARPVTERVRRERKLEGLQQRTQALMSTPTAEATARAAVAAAKDVLGAELSGFHELTDDGMLDLLAGTASVDRRFDETPRYERDDPSDPVASFVWEAFESGETAVVRDTAERERLAGETPAGSGVVYPVADHGVLVVSSSEPRAFDEADVSLVELLGATLTTALQRVERESLLREREAKLESERKLFQRLLDTSPVGITLLDEDGHIVRANDHAESVLGLSASGITGRTYDDPEWHIVDGDGDPIPESDLPFSRVVREGEPVYDYEHGIRWPDGSERWVSVNAAPVEDDGDDGAVIAVISDVTEQREHERALERQNERLEEFASVVSHDLRNPLNAAEGFLDLAREDCDSEFLDDVARAHDRMNTLIVDLLDIAREGGTVEDAEPVDVSTLARNCWLNVETGTANLEVTVDRPVVADRSRLQQLLENLFRNAVEHGTADDEVTVRVGPLPDGFYVEDDGSGIPPERRSQVLESGYTTTDTGTGFGLAIVSEVASAHGWDVAVSESESGGARFEITGVTVDP